ncbi:hypothetical protein AAVH_09951 [Aphelenchoides avenae]|nr:hypothetical protein AAVH_09951 [Aphelenchus avenae]
MVMNGSSSTASILLRLLCLTCIASTAVRARYASYSLVKRSSGFDDVGMSGARTFVPMRFMLPSSVRAGGLRRSSLKRTLVPERHTRSRVDQYRNCYFNPVQCILMDARRK